MRGWAVVALGHLLSLPDPQLVGSGNWPSALDLGVRDVDPISHCEEPLDPIKEDAEQLDLGFGAEGPSFDPDLNVDPMTKEDEIGRNVDIVAGVESDALHLPNPSHHARCRLTHH